MRVNVKMLAKGGGKHFRSFRNNFSTVPNPFGHFSGETFFTSCSISGEIRSAVRIGALARAHLASASCQKGQWLLFLPFIYYERSSRSLIFRGAKSQAVSELRFRSRRTMNRRKDAADNSLPAVSDPAM